MTARIEKRNMNFVLNRASLKRKERKRGRGPTNVNRAIERESIVTKKRRDKIIT